MDPPHSTPGGKLRLMCSYGGYIIPRPHSKSLCYVGGETRIVSLPASSAALSVSALTAHLASTLRVNTPFTVKYQLPHHDLDALISISSEDDLQIMLEELERLSASNDSSRIRLFLFPIKPNPLFFTDSGFSDLDQPIMNRREVNGGGLFGTELTRTELSQVQLSRSGLNHPKTESWFVDSLRSAKLGHKGDAGAGFGVEGGGNCHSESNGLCGQESIVLETNSSFGSTSSSVSFSNLPPIREANVQQYQDCNIKLPSPESIAIASDGNATSGISCMQTMPIGACNDPVVPIVAREVNLSASSCEPDSKVPDVHSGFQMHKSAQLSAASPYYNLPQQQNVQTVDVVSHYVPQNPSAVQQVASYVPMYHPMFQPQQPHYPSNQPCQLYYVPLAKTQYYNYPVQCGLVHTSTFASGQPQMHPNASGLPPQPQVLVKEIGVAPPPVPELPPQQIYRNVPTANQVVHITYEQDPGHAQTHHQPQSFAVASGEATNYNDELDDDLARIQIYKSQPPPPISPSKYQTMTKATAALLSEALARLQANDSKQQIRTSETQ